VIAGSVGLEAASPARQDDAETTGTIVNGGNPLARLEPYGMLILIGLLFILPMLGAQLGVDLSIVSRVIASSTDVIIGAILRLTGNT
jgi:hypothetical protein